MPTIQQFRLPDAGEGLTEADIVAWKVGVGDTVRVNDPIVEIETAKSLVELPCPFAGVVAEILVPEGATVAVGTPIIAVDVDPDRTPDGTPDGAEPDGRRPVLVGYGPRSGPAARRPRVAAVSGPGSAHVPASGPVTGDRGRAGPGHVLAKPPVRALARSLGVDLAGLVPTGPGGVVTREDVESAATAPAPPRIDAGGREERIPVKGVRRATAEAMVRSAFTAPHVTEWVQVDATRTVRFVERLRGDPAFEGVKVSPLVIVATGLLHAVRRHPAVNATWDERTREIVVRHYVNLGIAAVTPRGLLVPTVKDADRLRLRELAIALNALTAAAREDRTAPSDLTGGTITITNVGVFGVDGGTPILNPGEAAILAVGRIRRLPWVHRGKVRPRWVTTLALSFDHRMVDGDLGSRVLADVAAVLEDPARALL